MIENLQNEIWLPVVGYENLYSVSNKGRIKAHGKEWVWNKSRWDIITKKEEHLLIPSIVSGYDRVGLCKEGTLVHRRIHRLLGIAFIPNPENKPQVNHKDGNKLNNDISNLEWATKKENRDHAAQNGLMASGSRHHASRRIKCDTLDIEFCTITKAAKELGLGINSICRVAKGQQRFADGLSFRYL